MAAPLTDKHQRPDGTHVVQVETPVYLTEDEAAVFMAVEYAGQPIMRGANKVQAGLAAAAARRMRKIGARPDTKARERYLVQQREKADEDAIEQYREVVKRHRSWRDGMTRLDVGTTFSLDEASVALALEYPQVPSRFGRMTVERGLRQAAEHQVLASKQAADPEAVATFLRLMETEYGESIWAYTLAKRG